MTLSQPCAVRFALLALFAPVVFAQPIGEVDTAFKLLGPDHKIVVEAFDDLQFK